jgi:hypothetical protein
VQLEGDAFDEVAQVVCAPDDFRVWCRRGAAHGDGPSVGVVGRREGLALFLGEHDRSVPVYYWPENANSLYNTSRPSAHNLYVLLIKEKTYIL